MDKEPSPLATVSSTDGLGLAPERAEDAHAEHWQALVRASNAIASSPQCGPEQAREFCAAVDRLSAALMRGDEPAYTADQIADACMAAEIPDSKFESLLIALRAYQIGLAPERKDCDGNAENICAAG